MARNREECEEESEGYDERQENMREKKAGKGKGGVGALKKCLRF